MNINSNIEKQLFAALGALLVIQIIVGLLAYNGLEQLGQGAAGAAAAAKTSNWATLAGFVLAAIIVAGAVLALSRNGEVLRAYTAN